MQLPALDFRSSKRTALSWGELHGCSLARVVANLLDQHQHPLLLIAADDAAANRLHQQLNFFLDGKNKLALFQSYETLVYDHFSPSPDIIAQRLAILSHLNQNEAKIYVVSLQTLLQRLPPSAFISAHSDTLKVDDQLEIANFRTRLQALGYSPVSQVQEYGEYAIRGAIIDFYCPTNKAPVRIELSDNQIETLRLFDSKSQLTTKKIDSAVLLPAQEFLSDKQSIKKFRNKFRATFSQRPDSCPIYANISAEIIPAGIEYYLPLFFDKMESLFDFLPKKTVCLYPKELSKLSQDYLDYVANRYQLLSSLKEQALLEPMALYMDTEELKGQLARFDCIETQAYKYQTQAQPHNFKTRLPPPLALDLQQKKPAQKLKNFIKKYSGRILITAPTLGYLEQLIELLAPYQVRPRIVKDWQTFLDSSEKVSICCGKLYEGTLFKAEEIAILTYYEIVGKQASSGIQSRQARTMDSLIQSLGDLEIGCATVHQDHGVGRFIGTETSNVGGYLAEFCILEYADQDKLYVPVTSLHLLSRYSGESSEHAPLHKLGSDQWNKAKRKAAQQAYDVAAELLDIQARRGVSKSICFDIRKIDYPTFAANFPYQETPDQARAIEDVLADMSSHKLTDRIICGDVGFGKTEVAMRAAFVAVQNAKQVSILVPTTLLAKQHYEAFRDRFANWPVRIEMLSRFVSAKNQKQTQTRIRDGIADIVIGTHTLLRTPPKFKNLGLIIIDEEHCFGVKDKEIIKSLRSSIDIVTLTATPIPRTLSMSLAGLRDLSIIATPPPGRQAIKTFVTHWDDALIHEACHRELRRGGQVFLLHNKIEDIEKVAKKLKRLIPKAKIAVAHGQMPKKALESIMMDFYNQNCNVLVSTTIIESGIDIPNANTIIINRADLFGLAQLHQLRGRVGRSHHAAYAYLLIPKKTEITADAMKRLEVIESLEELSIGFTIASHDLEIRGAGELLGKEQSGHVQRVGFAMYNTLLKRAIETLRSGAVPNVDQPLDTVAEINLGEPALILSDYIPDVNLRLVLYRRIAALNNEEDLSQLKVEMVDRFGKLPDYTNNLYTNASIRILCKEIGIKKVEASLSEVYLHFDEHPRLNIDKLINMVENDPQQYRFIGNQKLVLTETDGEMETVAQRESKIRDFISRFNDEQTA